LRRFERAFAAYVGTRFALATSSGTGALHLGLVGLRVGMGDEVLVPEVAGVATANAVRYTRATPVFVDIDPETWCLDPDSARRAITSRTKAIVPVHLYGHPADMESLTHLAREFGLKVLEDVAPAVGAEVGGRKAGSLGDLACFSFQGARLMTTGEGGMLVTNDEALFERVKLLADHNHPSRDPSAISYKYTMSNLQAALGLAQLERLEEMIAKKRLIHRWYRERLRGVAGMRLNVERPWARNVSWMTSVVLDSGTGISRDGVMASLSRRQIGCRPFFPPLSSLPMFYSRTERADRNPVAYRVAGQGINLPSGHNLTEEDVDRVCAALRETLATSSRRAA
jgi:perosamine synthetase